jgi:hypothetical protein
MTELRLMKSEEFSQGSTNTNKYRLDLKLGFVGLGKLFF